MKLFRELLSVEQPISREISKKHANTAIQGQPFSDFVLKVLSQREEKGDLSHPVRFAWMKERFREYGQMSRLERKEVLDKVVGWLLKAGGEEDEAQPPMPTLEAEIPLEWRQAARMDWLLSPIQYLKGVGPRLAEVLQGLGIRCALDLLWHAPLHYENLSQETPIYQAQEGAKQLFRGVLHGAKQHRTRTGKMLTRAMLQSDEGQLSLVWFNQPYLMEKLPWGREVIIAGRPKKSAYGHEIQNPELNPTQEAEDGLVPVYPLTEGLNVRTLRKLLRQCIDLLEAQPLEPLPPDMEVANEFLSWVEAMEKLHFPDQPRSATLARKRLIFEELLISQIFYLQLAQKRKSEDRAVRVIEKEFLKTAAAGLGFDLSPYQTKALNEILGDLSSPHPMRRLLQGDVGSGKTAVAALAMAAVLSVHQQVALIAPTEILAEQHYLTFQKIFHPLGKFVGLLTGSQSQGQKKQVNAALANGVLPIVIGTHALFEAPVQFSNLGLIVMDEHHRFGVEQRQKLVEKAPGADLLVMTATPIPRTLALTLYADLQTSLIQKAPAQRAGMDTRLLKMDKIDEALDIMERTVSAGQQVYFVCPLIEESEALQATAATARYEELVARFPKLRFALLHGRMKIQEKEKVMEAMRAGEVDVLVATTVIEVGVDVPNATLMIIENAERFGLAQLHQLRGRVGRGKVRGLCLLMAEHLGEKARERLFVMTKTHDGFEVAKMDFSIRGPGRVLGTEQSGRLQDFRLADLSRPADEKLLELARTEAERILKKDETLSQAENALLKRLVDWDYHRLAWVRKT